VTPGITWYDIFGVLPGSTQEQIQSAYESKASLLRPNVLAGAASPVLTAASRAQRMLDEGRSVLGDPHSRRRYDETVGIRRSGGGLSPPVSLASEPGSDFGFVPGLPGAAALGVLMELSEWLASRPAHQPGRIEVPDVRGLFYSVCREVAGRLDLRLATVRLTDHPMPVDGLVVSQSPRPPAKIRRGAELTIQVWHPPSRTS
jgi:curved DNA-binding protein CbpA